MIKISFCFCAIVVLVSALPCYAGTMLLGSGTAYPGDTVGIMLSIDPADYVTGFGFSFEYDSDMLTFHGISLSDDAEGNGIFRVLYSEESLGRVDVGTDDLPEEPDLNEITYLARLEFVVSSSASPATVDVRFVGSAYYEVERSGEWSEADTGNGEVTIGESAAPPGVNPPEVSLRMQRTEVLVNGTEARVCYRMMANDGLGYSSDAYVGVGLPNGRILYVEGTNQFSPSQVAIMKNMRVGNLDGTLNLGQVPYSAPGGVYTVYGTLTEVGKSPLKRAERISNLATTRFLLVTPIPTNTPKPVVEPTATPTLIEADFKWSPEPGEVDQNVTFTDQSWASEAEITSWTWTFNDGNPSTETGEGPHTVTWADPGYHDVTLAIEDEEGRTAETTKTITVLLSAR